jgi:acyl-CoA hydrolase
MPTIAQTTIEKIQWVFPEHAGAPGQIHGGRMMEWIVEAGTLAAARLARGNVALGAMDDIDFLHPVRVGEIAILRAQVEYVGRTSLEVGVRVWAENVATGQRSVTLNSHLVFVSVDENTRPRPVQDRITPADDAEAALIEEARQRREVRLARFAQHRTSNRPPSDLPEHAAPATTDTANIRWRFESLRPVLPEDALFGTTVSAGKLLRQLDEAGGILSMRYCRGLVMTACLDAMDFYSPIHTHEVVIFQACLNHVGTSSLEVGVRVLAEKPWTGEVREACRAFLTYVHLGSDLRPQPCLPFTPQTPAEQRLWESALVRREQRLERVKRLKAAIVNDSSGERR